MGAFLSILPRATGPTRCHRVCAKWATQVRSQTYHTLTLRGKVPALLTLHGRAFHLAEERLPVCCLLDQGIPAASRMPQRNGFLQIDAHGMNCVRHRLSNECDSVHRWFRRTEAHGCEYRCGMFLFPTTA